MAGERTTAGVPPGAGASAESALPGDSRDSAPDGVLRALRELLPDLEASGVTELEVTAGDARLYLRRRPGMSVATPESMAAAGDDEAGGALEEGLYAITTPLSGVYYGSPAPGEPPYVQEGDHVDAGQVVGLVEAMKVFNEIHTDVAGTVVQILTTSGQLVQAGDALMRLRPSPVVESETP